MQAINTIFSALFAPNGAGTADGAAQDGGAAADFLTLLQGGSPAEQAGAAVKALQAVEQAAQTLPGAVATFGQDAAGFAAALENFAQKAGIPRDAAQTLAGFLTQQSEAETSEGVPLQEVFASLAGRLKTLEKNTVDPSEANTDIAAAAPASLAGEGGREARIAEAYLRAAGLPGLPEKQQASGAENPVFDTSPEAENVIARVTGVSVPEEAADVSGQAPRVDSGSVVEQAQTDGIPVLGEGLVVPLPEVVPDITETETPAQAFLLPPEAQEFITTLSGFAELSAAPEIFAENGPAAQTAAAFRDLFASIAEGEAPEEGAVSKVISLSVTTVTVIERQFSEGGFRTAPPSFTERALQALEAVSSGLRLAQSLLAGSGGGDNTTVSVFSATIARAEQAGEAFGTQIRFNRTTVTAFSSAPAGALEAAPEENGAEEAGAVAPVRAVDTEKTLETKTFADNGAAFAQEKTARQTPDNAPRFDAAGGEDGTNAGAESVFTPAAKNETPVADRKTKNGRAGQESATSVTPVTVSADAAEAGEQGITPVARETFAPSGKENGAGNDGGHHNPEGGRRNASQTDGRQTVTSAAVHTAGEGERPAGETTAPASASGERNVPAQHGAPAGATVAASASYTKTADFSMPSFTDAAKSLPGGGYGSDGSALDPQSPAGQVKLFISKMHASGETRVMRLQLQPAELGTVRVKMEKRADGGHEISISADNAETLQAMQKTETQLRSALQEILKSDAGNMLFSFLHDGNTGGGGEGGRQGGNEGGPGAAKDTQELAEAPETAPDEREYIGDDAVNIRV